MAVLSLASLLVRESKAAIYRTALAVATAVGVPVTSWQAGDPTRALFHLESETLSVLEEIVAGFISSGFLDHARGVWLKVLAYQFFGVVVPEATYATTDVTLTNTGFNVYEIEEGDLTFKSTTSGKTYRNTTGGTLVAKVGATNGTLTITVIADEAGSDSSAGAGEIDDFVTYLGDKVTCSNDEAAIGIDEQDEATTRKQCRDKCGSFSPNGPKEAYSYVAREPTLALTNGCTRARVYGDSDFGDVLAYLAGPSGGVSSADRTLIETAILKWATPLCITPTVLAATAVPVPVTYELWIYKSCNKTEDEVAEDVEAALEAMIAARDIGGDIVPPATTGKLYRSLIESTIRATFAQAFRVSVSLPAGDTSLANNEVATLGTVTPTIHLVVDP